MGEIRIVSPGKTHGYPYQVCKKSKAYVLLLLVRDEVTRPVHIQDSSPDSILPELQIRESIETVPMMGHKI